MAVRVGAFASAAFPPPGLLFPKCCAPSCSPVYSVLLSSCPYAIVISSVGTVGDVSDVTRGADFSACADCVTAGFLFFLSVFALLPSSRSCAIVVVPVGVVTCVSDVTRVAALAAFAE